MEQSSEDNMIIFLGAIYHSMMQIEWIIECLWQQGNHLVRVTEKQNAINLGIIEYIYIKFDVEYP